MSHTLLLADDSVTIQRVIELTFADEDVQVVAVSDGDQAIARLEGTPPDIVLADIGMPGKNGYEVAEFIKRTPRLAHIPVVLLTGAFEPVDDAKVAAAGCDGVLAKPFEPQLVIGRVKELLARGSAHAASTPLASPAPVSRPLAAVPAPKKPILDDVERYFDQLDAAFATLKTDPMPPAPAEQPPMVEEQPPDVPLSYASPQSAFEAAPAEAIEAREATEPRQSQELRVPGVAVPSIADAFAALLAAEQRAPMPAAAAPWPASPPTAIVTDELVDQVARRVLDQLSDRVVRETVTALVSTIAERLVREEIERLKSAIK